MSVITKCWDRNDVIKCMASTLTTLYSVLLQKHGIYLRPGVYQKFYDRIVDTLVR